MASTIDHLWQSVLFVALVLALTAGLRSNSARLRLWLWRIAALKFVLPFSGLFALGQWLGFPVRHSAIAPPAGLVRAADAVMPFVAPAQSAGAHTGSQGVELAFALLLATAAAWFVGRSLGQSRLERGAELARIQAGTADPPPPGFAKTSMLAGTAFVLLAAPMIGGALRDRQWRQQALAIDTLSLRDAAITLSESPWRFGDRTEIVATADGVSIRKTNLQDLVAMVYGIDEFEVFGGALPWLESPRYDVRITGPVHAPAAFDPYSLRVPVTNYLSREFGVAIRVNGSCQEPCLNQESFTVERLPWKILNPAGGR